MQFMFPGTTSTLGILVSAGYDSGCTEASHVAYLKYCVALVGTRLVGRFRGSRSEYCGADVG